MRLLKFAVVGLVNTALSFAILNVGVWMGASATAAWVLAWIVGFVSSYALNRRWTYADRKGLPVGETVAKFAVANAIALGASTAVVWLAERGLATAASGLGTQARANVAALAGVAISMVVNYSLATFWAFRETHPRG